MDRNELDQNAMGGTELLGLGLEKQLSILAPQLLDKFQITRSRVRELDRSKKQILWLHDLPWDPESEHLRDRASLNRFDKLVFVSHWQQQMYNLVLGVPYSRGIVIPNAIDPIPFVQKGDPNEELRIIYHSTPHRGLEILVPVFDILCKHHDNLVLDVYSSFKLYGWEARDAAYERVFDRCRAHPNINYHGTVSNDEIRAALQKAHIFAYPSIWQETSCLCMIEAMSAGVLPVFSSLAALPETTGGIGALYDYSEDVSEHANRFINVLDSVIRDYRTGKFDQTVHFAKTYIDAGHSWSYVIPRWLHLLRSLDV